jgi:CDP-glucose 4,6-dehydratase
MRSQIGDVRDGATLSRAMQAFKPEVVLHLAAQPLVRLSYRDPVETYSTNVMGTVHLLEAARHCDSVRAIVNVTTDKCYDNREWVWGYREGEPMGGHDPYSSSKAARTGQQRLPRSFFLAEGRAALATARAGNVIGGGDWAADRLIPTSCSPSSAVKPGAHPQPARHAPLAACAGAAGRLPAPGRTTRAAGPGLCRSLELRPAGW